MTDNVEMRQLAIFKKGAVNLPQNLFRLSVSWIWFSIR